MDGFIIERAAYLVVVIVVVFYLFLDFSSAAATSSIELYIYWGWQNVYLFTLAKDILIVMKSTPMQLYQFFKVNQIVVFAYFIWLRIYIGIIAHVSLSSLELT